MVREQLERWQLVIYLAMIAIGLALGSALPALGDSLQLLLWPTLALLLYATFCQAPLSRLAEAFVEPRFLIAALIGNFVVIPILVWGLLIFAPSIPAVRLGLLLVLLVPCTDWFISFTQLGGGDSRRALAFAPLSLLFQMLLLPFYLWLFMDLAVETRLPVAAMLQAFGLLILLPLLFAYLTQRRWQRLKPNKNADRLALLPVPLLGMVVFLVAASQVATVINSLSLLMPLLLIFSVFLLLAFLLAKSLASLFGLPLSQGRALAFSFGTRNSFVVLPLALALPAGWELAAVVIVFQSLVELLGMLVYLWIFNRKKF